MNKLFYFLLAISIFAFSCGNDDEMQEPYNVDITIVSPTDGSTIEMSHDLTVEVKFDRADNATIHNILIEVLDSDDNVVETLEDDHKHTAGSYTYTGTYTPTATGDFRLKATTTDDADKNPNIAEAAFIVEMAPYEVNVNIHHPMEEAVLAVNVPVHVHTIFTHNHDAIIHHVTIHIMQDGNILEVLDEGHKHAEGEYTYQNMQAWTPTTPGTYMVHARTMNMDMTVNEELIRPFVVE